MKNREYTLKMKKHLDSVRPKPGDDNFKPPVKPTKEKQIKEYKNLHPEATKYRCAKDLKLSYKTVSKWWK